MSTTNYAIVRKSHWPHS